MASFQIKDFASIVSSMVNHVRGVTRKITDFNIGSVARSLLEAPAVEIDEFYQQTFNGLKNAIPVAVYQSFGFDLLAAEAASGVLTLTASPAPTTPIPIAAGQEFTSADGAKRYATNRAYTIGVGVTTLNIMVYAVNPGLSGNIPASTITKVSGSLPGVASVTNPNALINGRDQETEDERKVRFTAFVQSLGRGTVAAIRYAASSARLLNADGQIIEYCRTVLVREPYKEDPGQPVSLVEVYIHNGSGGTSVDLVARTQQVIDGYYDNGTPVPGYKAAGVKVIVYAASDKPIDSTGVVTVLPNFDPADVVARVIAAIQAYIQGLPVGDDVVRAEMVAAAMAVDGVYDFALSLPASGTVTVAYNEKALPGVMAITPA